MSIGNHENEFLACFCWSVCPRCYLRGRLSALKHPATAQAVACRPSFPTQALRTAGSIHPASLSAIFALFLVSRHRSLFQHLYFIRLACRNTFQKTPCEKSFFGTDYRTCTKTLISRPEMVLLILTRFQFPTFYSVFFFCFSIFSFFLSKYVDYPTFTS